MTARPEKRSGESWLSFYNRMNEWEVIARKEAAIESRVADRLALRGKFQNDRATTKQVSLDRRSLHELAENNPILRNVLRKLQK